MTHSEKSSAWAEAPPKSTDGFSRFSTPLLPPIYARLPVLTQLWLQSRLKPEAARELKHSYNVRRADELDREKADRLSHLSGPFSANNTMRVGDGGEKTRTVLKLPRGPGAHKPNLEEMEKVVEVFELEEDMRAGTVLNMGAAAGDAVPDEREEDAGYGNELDRRESRVETFLSDPHDAPCAANAAELIEYAPSYMLPSGRLDPDAFREAGWARPATVSNIGLQLDICRLLWPKVGRALWAERRWSGHVLLYLFRVVYEGLSTAARIWADTRMVDLVERTFRTGKRASWEETMSVFGLALGVRCFAHLVEFVTRGAVKQLEAYVDFRMEREYLAAQLGMSLQARNSPLHMARVREAGVFAGFEGQFGLERPVSGPWAMIQTLGDAVSLSIKVGIQGAMMSHMLWATLSGDPAYRWGNAALLTLSVAPTLMQLGYGHFLNWIVGSNSWGNAADMKPMRIEQATRAFATDSQYTLELVLFGLKDWVLEQWEAARKIIIQRQLDYSRRTGGVVESVYSILQSVVRYGFYALLATQSVSTSFSLGALHAHTEMSEEVLYSVREWKDCWQGVAQIPYYLAAFVASVDHDESFGPNIDYERHRQPEGMRIEAKGLGYTYPGANKATLHDINLTIEPGQTIAIVGTNGGGKTTLVKSLLGLQGHTGGLQVNGIEIDDYDHTTLHKRMSCLFQDYCKYPMSLRVNVGLGDTEHMKDNRSILTAIKRGGARPVLAQVGLEGQLNPYQQPMRDSHGGQPRRKLAIEGSHSASDSRTASKQNSDEDTDSDNGSDVAAPDPEDEEEDDYDVGTCISGGQWQRVALSRAFMRAGSADLVVFDEPSASLDPKAEAELFERIHSLSEHNATTIFISHRYATVKRADKIAFVEDGTIIEFGSHQELMEKKGKYWEMYTLQADAFR